MAANRDARRAKDMLVKTYLADRAWDFVANTVP